VITLTVEDAGELRASSALCVLGAPAVKSI
jgi:hypothetical protein